MAVESVRAKKRAVHRVVLAHEASLAPRALHAGLVWAVAFRQTLPYMWKMGQKLSLNAGDPSNSNFSVLDWIGNCCCADGRFRFMYRDQHEGQYVVWQQSTNPVLSTKVEGFKDLAWGPRMKARDNRFRGLALSGGNNCLMHGNDQGYWWYSVGAYKRWDGDIPALQQGQELSSKCVELLVAVEPETLVRVVEKIRESLEPHDEMERLQAAVERDLKGRGTALRGVEMDLKKHRLNLKREIGFLKSKADFTNMEDAHSLLDEVATVVDAVNAELKRRRMGLMGLCLEVHTLAGERVLLLTETRAKACRDYLVARMVEREPSDGIDPCALVRSKGVVKSDRTTVVIRLSFPGEDSG